MAMKILSLVAFGLVILALSSIPANGITCQEALADLLPCQSFLVGNGPPDEPSAGCCLGAQNVYKQATTQPIRQLLCECFKKAAAQIGSKTERAQIILTFCKIQVPVPINPDVNCGSIPIF